MMMMMMKIVKTIRCAFQMPKLSQTCCCLRPRDILNLQSHAKMQDGQEFLETRSDVSCHVDDDNGGHDHEDDHISFNAYSQLSII